MDKQSNDTNAAEDKAAEDKAAETKAHKEKILTAAGAAKLVHRTVVVPPEKEGGKAVTKKVAIEEKEVLDFKDLGDRVVVVTTDGQKFYGDK